MDFLLEVEADDCRRLVTTARETMNSIEPSVDSTTIDFTGETGDGAKIDLYLPQPGQHVGRRILKLEGIPESVFNDEAQTFGTEWAEYLGLVKSGDRWQIDSPSRLRAGWLGRYSTAAKLSPKSSATVNNRFDNWVGISPGQKPQPRLYEEGSNEDESDIPDNPMDQSTEADDIEEATDRFTASTAEIDEGLVHVPTNNWPGGVTDTTVDLEEPPVPRFFVIQVIGITSFLGNFGLGRNVKTFSLLPGEEYRFSSRSWRSSTEKATLGTSIIDSYDESSAERFADTVQSETTDTATQSQSENWFVEAEAGASFGVGSASVSAGGGGEYNSGTEEFSKSMDEAIQEHSAEASSHRENTVTSSTETTTTTEDEEVVERIVRNINVSRCLNFTFREANQEHRVITSLKSVRIAYSNGNAESWREVPVSGLRSLVTEFVQPAAVDKVCSQIIGTIALSMNADEVPVPVLDQVEISDCGYTRKVTPAQPNDNCEYAPPTDDMYYRFRSGPLAQPADENQKVDGVVLSDRTIMLGSDSLVVEALLGQSPGLDEYSQQLQNEAIRSQRLANDRTELAMRLIETGTADQVAAFRDVFGICCEAETAVEEDGATAIVAGGPAAALGRGTR